MAFIKKSRVLSDHDNVEWVVMSNGVYSIRIAYAHPGRSIEYSNPNGKWIATPYQTVNISQLSYDQAFAYIVEWLDGCAI